MESEENGKRDTTKYNEKLKTLMDQYANETYRLTRKFPKEETFGLTSQYRRAALSVILNHIEGYARQREAVFRNFLEISYGSLKESKYLGYFSFKQKYITQKEYEQVTATAEEIGKMLWGILSRYR